MYTAAGWVRLRTTMSCFAGRTRVRAGCRARSFLCVAKNMDL
jgi:hypothetical protein